MQERQAKGFLGGEDIGSSALHEVRIMDSYTSLESAICQSAALCILNLLENLLNKSFRWRPKSKVSPATAAAAAAASRG